MRVSGPLGSQWHSSEGTIMVSKGQAAQNGGGTFMLPYFAALLLLGIPLCWAEWTMGRYGGLRGFHSAPGIYATLWRRPIAKYFGVLPLSDRQAVEGVEPHQPIGRQIVDGRHVDVACRSGRNEAYGGIGLPLKVIGALLMVAGAATLVAIKWGLKDDGLICVTVLLSALAGARVLACEPGR